MPTILTSQFLENLDELIGSYAKNHEGFSSWLLGHTFYISAQGRGIKGFIPTSVIQGNGVSLWEALFVVSQKWIPFPTALFLLIVVWWKSK